MCLALARKQQARLLIVCGHVASGECQSSTMPVSHFSPTPNPRVKSMAWSDTPLARSILDRASEDKNPVLLRLGTTCFSGSKCSKPLKTLKTLITWNPRRDEEEASWSLQFAREKRLHVAPSQAKLRYLDVFKVFVRSIAYPWLSRIHMRKR
jgi:hypothetical protein